MGTPPKLILPQNPRGPRMTGSALWVAGMFVICCVMIPGAFVSTALQLRDAARAASFPAAPGVIVTSRAVPAGGAGAGDDASSAPQIEYRFHVGEDVYTGTRVHSGPGGFDATGTAAELLARYPEGKPVAVYYDPEDPRTAMLVPGIVPADLLVAMVMLPFGAMGLAGFVYVLRRWRGKRFAGSGASRGGRAGRLLLREEGSFVHVRVAGFSPLLTFLLVFTGAMFAGLLIATVTPALRTSMAGPLGALAVGVVAGSWAARASRRSILRGETELGVQRESRSVVLPAVAGRRGNLAIPGDAIRELEVLEREHRASRGQVNYTYTVRVRALNDAGMLEEFTATGPLEYGDAVGIAEWLRGELSRPAR